MRLLSAAFLLPVLIIFFFRSIVFAVEEIEGLSLPAIFEYPAVKGRDPFVPLVKEEKPVQPKKKTLPKKRKPEKKTLPVITNSEYTLVGIVWSEGESMALIVKKDKTWIAKEGTVLNGLRVARINGEKGEVTLVGKEKIIQLKLMGK